MVQGAVREKGVTPFYKMFEHDGVRGPNIATVYSDRGQGVRAPVVFYNRSNEAGSLLKVGDFDWKQIMAGGCRWFHSGGIFAALSPTTAELIIDSIAKLESEVNRELSGLERSVILQCQYSMMNFFDNILDFMIA